MKHSSWTKRFLVAWAGFLLVLPCAAMADQLAYISKADARKAAKWIEDHPLILTYCSLCDNEPVEMWHVQETRVKHTGFEQYHQVVVKARKILTSTRVFNQGEYREPVEYDYVGHPDSALEELELDFAYVYSPAGGVWQCTGRLLKMECEILVERIRL